jgi:hypothetical protein
MRIFGFALRCCFFPLFSENFHIDRVLNSLSCDVPASLNHSAASHIMFISSLHLLLVLFSHEPLLPLLFLCSNPLLFAAQASTLLGGPLEDLRLGWSS